MEPDLESAISTLAVVTPCVALVLGYLSERDLIGTIMLFGATMIACLSCLVGVVLGGWIGLLVAILLVTFLAYRVGNSFGKERGSVFVPALWLGFCASCAIGYWAGGTLGFLTITLPSLVILWGGLFLISPHLLPLLDHGSSIRAFRSLVTFNLGTNFPYHALEDRELKERVSGNPYGRVFAGPGIVLTDPAHAPIIWEGLRFKDVGHPGLTFTKRFETIYQTVDLRPQLRSFYVDAITKDGIRIKVLTFVPFRLNWDGQEPKLQGSFPFDKKRIFKTMWAQPVESGQKRAWDDVVVITASRIMRQIIGQYRCDELCECFDPGKDPRTKIRDELKSRLEKELQEYEIELIGGGISNLDPEQGSVIDQRIKAWQAEWERKIQTVAGEGKANAIWEVERAHAQAQASLIAAIHHVVEERPGIDPELLTKIAALRFIEALEDMACTPQVQEGLPQGTAETMGYMRKVLS
jgi:regulator of protease activity HflC (stomatin/prohibitin superfamily)